MVHHKVHSYQARSILKILMVRSPGPYIFIMMIRLTISGCRRLLSKYFGLHQIPRKPQKFKTYRLSCLYYVIMTQQSLDADNKGFDGFGDPPSTHPLSEVMGDVSNILNYEKSWQDFRINNQTHLFSNRTDLYQLLPSTPPTVELCTLLVMTQISL